MSPFTHWPHVHCAACHVSQGLSWQLNAADFDVFSKSHQRFFCDTMTMSIRQHFAQKVDLLKRCSWRQCRPRTPPSPPLPAEKSLPANSELNVSLTNASVMFADYRFHFLLCHTKQCIRWPIVLRWKRSLPSFAHGNYITGNSSGQRLRLTLLGISTDSRYSLSRRGYATTWQLPTSFSAFDINISDQKKKKGHHVVSHNWGGKMLVTHPWLIFPATNEDWR